MNFANIEKESVEDHLRAMRSNEIITSDTVDINGKVHFMVHQSSSQYGGIRSAINHVCVLARVKIP